MTKETQSEYIRQLQRFLYGLSLFDPYMPRVVPDGIYGAQTKNAVISYQRKNGLRPTGDADEKTWNMIKNSYDKETARHCKPEPLCVFPGGGCIVKPGEKSETVMFIQLVLSCLSAEYGYEYGSEPTGVYTDTDAEAVRKLQSVHGLDETGCVDVVTWNCICSDYSMFCFVNEYKK